MQGIDSMLGERGEKQIEFDFSSKEPEEKRPEVVSCQYCQDVGPCDYCSRGKKQRDEMLRRGEFKKDRRGKRAE